MAGPRAPRRELMAAREDTGRHWTKASGSGHTLHQTARAVGIQAQAAAARARFYPFHVTTSRAVGEASAHGCL